MLANLFLQLGQQDRAMDFFGQILKRDPTHLIALNNLAVIAVERGHLDSAERLFRQALQHHPKQVTLHCGLGQVLKETGRDKEAMQCYETGVQLQQNHAPSWFGIGALLLDRGQPLEARRYFEHALKYDPTLTEVWPHQAKTKRYAPDQDGEEIAIMERTLTLPGLQPHQISELSYALGKVHDDCGHYERAFQHYRQANQLRKKARPYDSAAHNQKIQQIIDTFTPEWLAKWQTHGAPSKRPIFVVGLPRSGTSLAEQILASHPDVHGAGELEHFHRAVQLMPGLLNDPRPFPLLLDGITPEQIAAQAKNYLVELETLNRDAPRVVNKMPGDFFYLGWIRTLFPNAVLIHCRRNLLDTALSLYFQDFGARHPYSTSLTHIYEDLINDSEGVSRALLDHCGLAWHDVCLTFYKTRRLVKTASNWQVRQPLYRSSMARWRCYEPWIGALKARLQPQET